MDYSRNWNILCWNVRGLNDPDKWDLIRNKLEVPALSFVSRKEKRNILIQLLYKSLHADDLIVLIFALQKVPQGEF
jgi:hypothetical protein